MINVGDGIEVYDLNFVNLQISGTATNDTCSSVVSTTSGSGKVIVKNVTVDATSDITCRYNPGGIVGYIGGTADCELENLTNNANITALGIGPYAGGIASRLSTSGSCKLKNVHNTGTVTAGNNSHGGIVGLADGGTYVIEDCSNTGNIVSTGTGGQAGGIISTIGSGGTLTIEKCNNSGNFSGPVSSHIGGILGNAIGTATIKYSYNSGTITTSTASPSFIGGILGGATGSVIATDNYNTGDISTTNTGTEIGGVVGRYNSGNFSRNYNVGAVNIPSSAGNAFAGTAVGSFADNFALDTTNPAINGGTRKTDAEMRTKATYTNWDFTTVWQITDGVSYPTLR